MEKIRFKAVRAKGPGGQNVNRRSTKVELWVKVADLPIADWEKKMVKEKLAHRINHDGEIWITEEGGRSQELNRDKALERLNNMIEEAVKIPEPRIPTRPPKRIEENRIREKKMISAKKKNRRSGN